jgi:hypothetical protein
MSRVLPKAFTEKGLYMLATILKGKKLCLQPLPLLKHLLACDNRNKLLLNYRKQSKRHNKNRLCKKVTIEGSNKIIADYIWQ